MSERFYRVMLAHQRIDRALNDARQRRWVSSLELVRLKKLKLRAKDLMHRLMHTAQPVTARTAQS